MTLINKTLVKQGGRKVDKITYADFKTVRKEIGTKFDPYILLILFIIFSVTIGAVFLESIVGFGLIVVLYFLIAPLLIGLVSYMTTYIKNRQIENKQKIYFRFVKHSFGFSVVRSLLPFRNLMYSLLIVVVVSFVTVSSLFTYLYNSSPAFVQTFNELYTAVAANNITGEQYTQLLNRFSAHFDNYNSLLSAILLFSFLFSYLYMTAKRLLDVYIISNVFDRSYRRLNLFKQRYFDKEVKRNIYSTNYFISSLLPFAAFTFLFIGGILLEVFVIKQQRLFGLATISLSLLGLFPFIPHLINTNKAVYALVMKEKGEQVFADNLTEIDRFLQNPNLDEQTKKRVSDLRMLVDAQLVMAKRAREEDEKAKAEEVVKNSKDDLENKEVNEKENDIR